MMFTVLGATGFLGSHAVEVLRGQNSECWAVPRGDKSLFERALGHVLYCVGVTADFRRRPSDTMRAHVEYLRQVLEAGSFDSLLYVSSTRVYAGAESGSEDADLRVNPNRADDLYNASKIAGEAVCLADPRIGVRVVRLSNVYGHDFASDNFLSSVLRDCVERREVVFQSAWNSERDFVSVRDVVTLLPRIASAGRCRLYNIASGVNTSNEALAAILRARTGSAFSVATGARKVTYPNISIGRIRDEFGFRPHLLADDIDELLIAHCQRTGEASS